MSLFKSIQNFHLAFNGKCLVNFSKLTLPYSVDETIAIMRKAGFSINHLDVISLARKCIGKSVYIRGASLDEAPKKTDCSSFTQWVFSQVGKQIPRISKHQRDFCPNIVKSVASLQAGDLVFCSSKINWGTVGHVGIATGIGTIIHSQRTERPYGIVETSLDRFAKNFRGARRIILDYKNTWIIQNTPKYSIGYSREVETFMHYHNKSNSSPTSP